MSANKLLQAAAGNAAGEAVYVDDVFATNLYQGDSSTGQTITNGIDLSGEGGMVWFKTRSTANANNIYDTERGNGKLLYANTAEAQYTNSTNPWTPSSTGFNTGDDFGGSENQSGADTVAWTFRKQAGFFDVVTYTGNSTAGHTISHNLGSVPGMILIKRLDGTGNWAVYHRGADASAPEDKYLYLNTTAAVADGPVFNDYAPTDTDFQVGSYQFVNNSGSTFVAYLFAHDDQSFGDDSDESIIKCGSYLGSDASDVDVNLGFEPQWLMIKNTERADNWTIIDSMRGLTAKGSYNDNYLSANATTAETTGTSTTEVILTATGFTIPTGASSEVGEAAENYIYIAIRRPMKTPEAGTDVFKAVSRTGNSTAATSITCGFPLDWVVTQGRSAAIEPISYTRLQGSGKKLFTYSASAEGSSGTNVITSFDQDGMTVGTDTDINNSSYTYINWFFKRATGFMDVAIHEGNQTANRDLPHNLTVTPEMYMVKSRTTGESWYVYHKDMDSTAPEDFSCKLDNNSARLDSADIWGDRPPTATTYAVGQYNDTNGNGKTYLTLLFATLDGVSKVGSYTGTGSNVDVNCGFSSTARFVLIKRTDSTGDWYVYDHARGIVAGNDPFQEWNNAAAETGSTDYIDPLSTGFTITSSAPADLNASGGNYIFLAIAQVTHGIQSTFKR